MAQSGRPGPSHGLHQAQLTEPALQFLHTASSYSRDQKKCRLSFILLSSLANLKKYLKWRVCQQDPVSLHLHFILARCEFYYVLISCRLHDYVFYKCMICCECFEDWVSWFKRNLHPHEQNNLLYFCLYPVKLITSWLLNLSDYFLNQMYCTSTIRILNYTRGLS